MSRPVIVEGAPIVWARGIVNPRAIVQHDNPPCNPLILEDPWFIDCSGNIHVFEQFSVRCTFFSEIVEKTSTNNIPVLKIIILLILNILIYLFFSILCLSGYVNIISEKGMGRYFINYKL